MAMTFIRSTRAVRQITMDTYVLQKSISPLNYLPWIIPLELSPLIFLGPELSSFSTYSWRLLYLFTILVWSFVSIGSSV